MAPPARILASLLAAAAVSLAACGGGDDRSPSTTSGTRSPATTGTTATTTAPTTTPPATPATQRTTIYLTRGEQVAAVGRDVPATPAVAGAALRALLAGPTAAERAAGFGSQVPAGTELRGLTIRDGLATVDLTRGFESGGGSLSMTLRVAQVVHTLTGFATVRRVAFRLDGRPVAAIGGEGVVVDPPVDRASFEGSAPQILVESPLPGDAARPPLRVRGTANTFEATFVVDILGPGGKRLARKVVTATSGSGTRGTFDVSVPFAAPAPGTALTLYAFEPSAKDGSALHEVRIGLRAG